MTPQATDPAPRRSVQDAAAHVTAEIMLCLERGVLPWRAPWDTTLAHAMTPGLPLRANGKPYKGANVFLLWTAQLARGYAKRTWLTYRNAEVLGAHVRKGEKATPVIYYGPAKPRTDAQKPAEDDAKSYRFLKLFHVFNAEQCENLPTDFGIELAPPRVDPPEIVRWLERAGAKVSFGGASAHYAPSTDTIHLPPIAAFRSKEHAAATAAHEGIHWVGAESRLDTLKGYFTDRVLRAKEELRAECGAAIVGAMTGLAPDHLEDHAAYVSSWLSILKSEPRAFLSAAAKAQAPVDWLVERAGHPGGANVALAADAA
ncbi:MAG: zincin-like metallopeptidase domain-containing protein [Hyphomonadaceae bacterium]|nr:zincin-like metallopeptidase domain-containing protein [Hyphomonadaceae bacterium]